MFTTPTRAPPAFAATSSATVPLAFALPPDATAIHDAELAACHAQPDSVVTPTDSRPPFALMLSRVRLSSNRQGAPACFSSARAVSTTMAPVRAEGVGLGDTVKGTTASPWPPCEP
jgi:hypothetical protein